MYFKTGEAELSKPTTTIEKAFLILNAIIIIVLGVLPNLVLLR